MLPSFGFWVLDKTAFCEDYMDREQDEQKMHKSVIPAKKNSNVFSPRLMRFRSCYLARPPGART